MKVLNIKTTGSLILIINQDEFLTEISHVAFSAEQQSALNDLVASLQAEGVRELHVEEREFQSFVHKVKNDEVLASDNVNSYQVFVDLEHYVNAIKNYEPNVEGE